MRAKPFPMTPMTPVRAAPPGPSSLRRLVTSRSDVFLSQPASRQESYSRSPQPPNPATRRLSAAGSSSAARTSGSSWDTDKATRSSVPTSQLSSRPVSIHAKPNPNLLSPRPRAPSLAGTSPGKSFPPRHIGPGGITMPLNNSVSHLATLSHSAHTLSPYARGHEHIAVRSFPHLGKTGLSAGSSSSASLSAIAENAHGPVKARRKRIFHINKKEDDDSPLSPDIDDVVHHGRGYDSTPSPGISTSPPSSGRGGSGMGMSGISGNRMGASRPVSLTAAAQRVMGDATVRPNYGRAPASRTSYGFPTSQRL